MKHALDKPSVLLIQEKDFTELLEVERQIFGDLAYDKFVFHQLFCAHTNLIFVSKFEEKIRGYCLASFDVCSDLSWILSLGVVPAFQGRGAGSNLLTHVEEKLKSLGSEEVALHVSPNNRNALELYEKFGYVKTNLIEDFGEVGQVRLEMRKKL